MTIVEAVKDAMYAASRPMSAREAYVSIIERGTYEFGAADPVGVVRSQILRHCDGVSSLGSPRTKHFERHTDGRYIPVDPPATKEPGRNRPVLPPAGRTTIIEAIRRVLTETGRPLTPREVHKRIVDRGLYEFRAAEPVHVVRSQLRRHTDGLDFPSASDWKHFDLQNGGRYGLIPKPFRRKPRLADVGRVGGRQAAPERGDNGGELGQPTPERTEVFISYCHCDKKWMDRLHVHLRPLEKPGLVSSWDDTRIKAGDHWKDEIAKAIGRARIAVLLVSADFLASEFIVDDELPPLLKAAADEGVRILPVIVSPCRFEKYPELSLFQAINPPSKPLTKLDRTGREEVFVRVTDSVEAALYPA